ncbi:hypothetical protein Gohar_020227, partial [Gossypium harknessii]|nr:hypothetical protein [Gossypium harknessii]
PAPSKAPTPPNKPPKTAAPPYKAPRTPTTPWNPPRRPSPPVKTIKGRGFDQLWYILPSLALIKDIQNMCKRHWSISIKYIPREINRVADFLAKQALVSICLRNPIPAILQLLEVDARGSISAAAALLS